MISGKLSQELETVNMLSEKLRLTTRQLYFITYNLDKFYTVYKIPKKNGKFRTIEAPAPLLKKIQRKILQEFVSESVPKVATAFEKKRNIIKNAEIHLNQPVIIGLDIKNFFPAVKFNLVRDYFKKKTRREKKLLMLKTA